MARWVWSFVVLALTVAAFALDRLIWPDRVNYELYAVPMLLTALRWQPEAVLVCAVGSVLLALYDFLLDHDTTAHGALGLGVLLVVAFLALTYALRREEAQREIREKQAAIDTVQRLRQPVAVILGYAQLLTARSLSAAGHARAHAAVCRAALDLRSLLDALLARWGAG
jgi:hypothetical protein